MTNSYNIKLAQFEGPFDLLLFFIERDELDIYDIPIAKITNEFLDYLRQMERLNINLASEFMVVAATLMRIKAKMLIPRKELNEVGEEIDPRQELVARLIEYKQYKAVVSELKEMEEQRHRRHKRGNLHAENHYILEKYTNELEIESVNLYKILNAFNRVLKRYNKAQEKSEYEVVRYPYTIDEQKAAIRQYFVGKHEATFTDIFTTCQDRIHAVFRFLSMLELIQEKWLTIRVGIGMNNFWLLRRKELETSETEQK